MPLGSGSFFAFPTDADNFGDTGLLHGDAVENAAGFHSLAIVGHDNELCLRTHFADQAREASDVRFVQWRIDFIENAKRTWLIAEYRDEQRERGHGFFSAGEEQHILQPF